MLMIQDGGKSYLEWAGSLKTIIGKTVSKQALSKRMTAAWVATTKELLNKVLGEQAVRDVKHSLYRHFGRVLLQDSTSLSLPAILLKVFKGNVSRGEQKSVAKLNVIIDIVSGICPVMEWMSFTVTEQALSSTILQVAKAGDLVIRDLGYFVLDVFGQMNEEGIYFLSRLKSGVTLYDAANEKEINLCKLLKGKARIDREVLCGKEQKFKGQLVAIKLSHEQASERRRKAKKDRDKRLNHSKEYYELLGYIIFITNVGEDIWDYQQVAEAYRARWNIEILFKSWKSGFHIEKIIPEARKQTARVESILYLMLIYIAWFQMLIYVPLRWYLKQMGKQLSFIKAAKWIKANTLRWIDGQITTGMKKEIAYYCCYDTRHDKLNAIKHLEKFFMTLG